MKYYEQLLESFTKLKKRTFKLTVLEDSKGKAQEAGYTEALQAAKDALTAFLNSGQNKGVLAGTNVPVTLTRDGAVQVDRRGTYTSTGGGGWQDKKSRRDIDWMAAQSQSNAGRLVALFMPKGEEAPAGGQQQAGGEWTGEQPMIPQEYPPEFIGPVPDGETARNIGISKITADKFSKLGKAFDEACGPELLERINSLRAFKDRNKKMKRNPFTKCEDLRKYIAGGWRGSLELKFGPDNDLVVTLGEKVDEKGNVINTIIPVGTQFSEAEYAIALGKLTELMKVADDPQYLPEEEKRAFLDNFSILSNGSVLIRTDEDSGLVIRDSSSVIAGVLEDAKSQIEGYNFLDFTPPISSGKIAALRGKMLETLKTLRMLVKRCRGPKGIEKKDKDQLACAAAEETAQTWRDQLNILGQIHEWANRFENDEIGINSDDLHIIDFVDQNGSQGENLVSLFKGMLKMSKASDDMMNADFVVPVGDLAAVDVPGDKDDAIYVYHGDNCGNAVAGLMSKGYNEVEADALVNRTTMKETFSTIFEEGGSKPMLQKYMRKEFGENDPICTVQSGLKHTIAKESTNAGISWTDATAAKMENSDDQMLIEGAKHFAGEGATPLQSQAFVDRVRDYYNNNLRKIETTVRDLESLKNVQNGGPAVKKYDALDAFAKDTLKTFLDNNEYKDIIGSGKDKTLTALKTLLEKEKKQIKTNQGRAFIREILSRNLMIRRLQRDLGSKNAVTKQSAGDTARMLVFATGGSRHDSSTIESRILSTGEMVSMRHNEIIDFTKTAIVQIQGNTIIYEDPNNPMVKVTLSLSRDRTRKASGPLSKWRVDVSKEFFDSKGSNGLPRGKKYGAKAPISIAASTEYGDIENMIQEYLDNQKDMLMKILSS